MPDPSNRGDWRQRLAPLANPRDGSAPTGRQPRAPSPASPLLRMDCEWRAAVHPRYLDAARYRWLSRAD